MPVYYKFESTKISMKRPFIYSFNYVAFLYMSQQRQSNANLEQLKLFNLMYFMLYNFTMFPVWI